MSEIIDIFLKDPNLGSNGIFFSLFMLVFYFLRKDSKEHKEDYEKMAREMFAVLEKNTEAKTRLAESINNLKDKIV